MELMGLRKGAIEGRRGCGSLFMSYSFNFLVDSSPVLFSLFFWNELIRGAGYSTAEAACLRWRGIFLEGEATKTSSLKSELEVWFLMRVDVEFLNFLLYGLSIDSSSWFSPLPLVALLGLSPKLGLPYSLGVWSSGTLLLEENWRSVENWDIMRFFAFLAPFDLALPCLLLS